MRHMTRRETGRPGFTLVELMVAMALTVLIMAILAGAFQVGLDTMSQLKSLAGLSEQLRSAEGVLLRDLSAGHLEDEWGRPVRVSDPQVQKQAWLGAAQKRGFFRARQVAPVKQEFAGGPYDNDIKLDVYPNGYPFVYEGTDPNGVPSFRAADQVLHMACRLTGANANQMYISLAPPALAVNSSLNRIDLAVGNQFVSPWAEVAYYLWPSGLYTTGDEASGGKTLTLYTLRRRKRVLTPPPSAFVFNPGLDQKLYPGVSVPPNTGTPANDPLAITDETKRLLSNSPGALVIGNDSPEFGTDVLLSNVISFQIRLQFETPTVSTPFMDEWSSQIIGKPYGPILTPDASNGARTYDTAFAPTDTSHFPAGVKPRVRAIQIKLRVYDPNNKLTRQITITQDL